jgi:hypothetical protein
MKTRVYEVESMIRDTEIHKIEFQYEYYTSKERVEKAIILCFRASEDELLELILIDPRNLDLFDDEFGSASISHIKAFSSHNSFEVSLDPYDERIEEIQENDNYVFQSTSYEIRRI